MRHFCDKTAMTKFRGWGFQANFDALRQRCLINENHTIAMRVERG